jgi:hypothetical protein
MPPGAMYSDAMVERLTRGLKDRLSRNGTYTPLADIASDRTTSLSGTFKLRITVSKTWAAPSLDAQIQPVSRNALQ